MRTTKFLKSREVSHAFHEPFLKTSINCLFFILITIHMSEAQSPLKSPHSNVYGTGWSAVHSDASNSDYSFIEGPDDVTLGWQRKFDGTINLGPTSVGGQVYITTSGTGCHLHALDAETGEEIWCSDEVNKFAVSSSALLDKDNHLFIADDQAMNAFDSRGRLIWKTAIVGFPLSAQFTQTGKLIFITHIGRIYILDRKTGEHILPPVDLIPGTSVDSIFDPRACMRGTEACPCSNTLAFDLRTGRFFFTFWAPGASKASLKAMQYVEEPSPAIKALWTNETLPGGSASSPDLSADGKRVYVNDNVDAIHAIDAATGENIWDFKIGYEPGGSQSTSPNGYIMPAGGDRAGLMCIVDKGDHAELLWKKDSLQNRGVATQSAGDRVYATVKTRSLKYDLVVVDVLTGKVLDREHLPARTLFSVGTTIGPEGNIYVPTFNGFLFMFRNEVED